MSRNTGDEVVAYLVMIGIVCTGFMGLIKAITAFYEENKEMFEFIFIAVVVIVIVFISAKAIASDMRTAKAEKLFHDTRRADLYKFEKRIENYLPVLARKKKLLTLKDDYGFVSHDKWNKEKVTFISRVGYDPICNEVYRGQTPESLSYLIDGWVDDYIRNNNKTNDVAYDPLMSPREYEQYCADILSSAGWEARLTDVTGDQGVDIIAEKKGITLAVQCKKYSTPVGNAAVQEVTSGMRFYGANRCAVVVNTSFTRSAMALANAESVILLHHDELKDIDTYFFV